MKTQLFNFTKITTIILLFLALPSQVPAQGIVDDQSGNRSSGNSGMNIVFPPHYCAAQPKNLGGLSPDNLPEGYNRPIVRKTRCGEASVRHQDEVQTVIPGGKLVRIVRRWEVCNRCPNRQCEQGVQIIQSELMTGSSKNLSNSQYSSPGFGSDGFELLQNRPNPFSGQTLIGFRLPARPFEEVTHIRLTVQQVDGRILYVMEGDYPVGLSELTIEAGTLPAEGVLFYTLTTPTHRATKRMVRIWK